MRLSSLRLGVALVVLHVVACSSGKEQPPAADSGATIEVPPDDGASAPMGYVDSGARPQPDSGAADAMMSVQPEDAGARNPDACVAQGCDELGYECGITTDNCGDPLNCNLENNVSPCVGDDRCGGDPALGPFKCGCKLRANACEAVGAQCDFIEECGQQVNCGQCQDGVACIANRCTCTPSSDPCAGRTCGEVDDGCGKKVKCGPDNGACTTGSCSSAGMCMCRPRDEACLGRTGSYVENGCTYSCGGLCVPDNVKACAGAECGTAQNECGEIVQCGAAAGACAAGNSCVNGRHVTDGALPPRSANFQGGYCVPSAAAKLLGKYVLRIHAFRQAGTAGVGILNRAETIALTTITYARTPVPKITLTEQGCTATTKSAGSGLLSARFVSPGYHKIPPTVVEVTANGDQWQRLDAPHPVIGSGVPTGYQPGVPPFCVGKEGQTVDVPQTDTLRNNIWPDDKCVCPLAAQAASMLPNTLSTTISRDCRVIDDDQDGKPGFTLYGQAAIITSSLYNASNSHALGFGTIRDDRYHVGYTMEAVKPLQRAVVGCSASGPLCGEPGLDCGCPEKWNFMQYVPLPDDAVLNCNDYLNAGASDPFQLVNQTKIETTFASGFGSCSAAGQCPFGSICRANRCVLATAPGSCTSGTRNPCPAGTFCEGCPDDPTTPAADMECLPEGACWPTAAICPATQSAVGGLCGQ